MLVECGFVRATASDGGEWTFTPSFGRIASLGDPHEIVKIYAALHGPHAAKEAAYVLACLCDQEDPTPLIGGVHVCKEAPPVRSVPWWKFWATQERSPTPAQSRVDEVIPRMMPISEQIIIARHLMLHGIVGKARPSKGGGQYSDRFDVSEQISVARAHLGLSTADAEALSMTEFQTMLEMKFPESASKAKDVPTREEYDAAMAALKERKRG